MWAIIGTWAMAFEAIKKEEDFLKKGGFAGDSIERAIKEIEDYPYFKSVGFGGLPNEDMEVELDAAYMDGSDLAFGACGGVKNIKNPISLARELSKLDVNNFLIGEGAEKFADQKGLQRVNMLTDRAKIFYKNRILEEKNHEEEPKLKPYKGHDTVGLCCLDEEGNIIAGTSTSGLFMKKRGRLGDSPVIGAGLYAESDFGAAVATGLGEDSMKGCISYEIVRLMKDGLGVQAACDKAVSDLEETLLKKQGKCGDLSVVALDKEGNFGVSSNIENFSFAIASEKINSSLYLANRKNGRTSFKLAEKVRYEAYLAERKRPLKLLEKDL